MDIVKLQSCRTLKPFNSGYQAKMRNGVHLSFSSFTVASSVLGLYTTEAPQGKDFVNGSFFPHFPPQTCEVFQKRGSLTFKRESLCNSVRAVRFGQKPALEISTDQNYIDVTE